MRTAFLSLLLCFSVFAEDVTIEPEVLRSKPIALDGVWDSGWSGVRKVYKVTRTGFESVISIRSMINHETIYFLFEWDDKTLNSQHKPWIWDEKRKMYIVGDKREDRFIVRWGINIDSERINSRNDLWYWGSVRANQGKADDRHETLSKNPIQKGLLKKDFDGNTYYLQSQPDVGKRAWNTEYQKKAFWLDRSRYKPEISQKDLGNGKAKEPTVKGSREDVIAFARYSEIKDFQGNVKGGKWTMEVARKLSTGNSDDVEFNWGMEYYFDISKSMYENAHIVHNLNLVADDSKPSEEFPLKLKMPQKPLVQLDLEKDNIFDEKN